ncbi:MAG: GNAT family N-acetyltransferase [Chloroflexi bacterium]|nr:GNAT family N-acetyltransferase [Chloroflexota bacterium]
MHLTPYQLIKKQLAALFISDAHKRLRYIREPGYEESELDPAPRFFMGRTLNGNVWRFRHDVPETVVQAVDQVCHHEPIAQNLKDTPHQAAVIRTLLNKDMPVTEEWRGPAYWIPESDFASTDTMLISEVNAYLLEAHFPWKITSKSNFRTGPVVAKVVQGQAISICYCARITPFAAEAGVETVSAFRGRGYATDAVAEWATVVRQLGLTPLYSTSWDNVASQGVARKLNMVHYGDDWSIT